MSTLCDTNLTFTNPMLQANFDELSDIDAHLTFDKAINPNLKEYEDSGPSSHLTIPGLYSKSFELNEIYLTSIGHMEYYYLPRHMQSTSSTVALGNGGLRVCINFETGGPEELYCAVDGGPDSNCPNADATRLRICAELPLGFDDASRLITVGAPDIDVSAAWNITIGLNYDVSDKVNSKLKGALSSFLSTSQFRQTLGKNLTLFFHDHLLSDERGNHGEILDFQAGDGAILIVAKSASGALSYCPE